MKLLTLPEPKDRTVWHEWFAWRPVFVGRTLVWLEPVMRIDRYAMGFGMSFYLPIGGDAE